MTKRKTKPKVILQRAVSVIIILVITLLIYENKKYIRRAYRYITHQYSKTAFSTTTFPENYTVHGIDISHYQDVTNWKKLFAIDSYGDTVFFKFVFMKATEGLLIEDGMFDENWEDARDNHFIRGAYHYFLPDRSAKLQATNFITSVRLLPGDLPPVIDVEETRGKTKEQVVKAVKEFIALIEGHYKVKPIIYSNMNFIEDYLADDFKSYRFWVAHYYRDQISMDDDSLQWVFWQHSDKADLAGINGRTDANVFNGSERELAKLLIK